MNKIILFSWLFNSPYFLNQIILDEFLSNNKNKNIDELN